jgi:hypothetical protein
MTERTYSVPRYGRNEPPVILRFGLEEGDERTANAIIDSIERALADWYDQQESYQHPPDWTFNFGDLIDQGVTEDERFQDALEKYSIYHLQAETPKEVLSFDHDLGCYFGPSGVVEPTI